MKTEVAMTELPTGRQASSPAIAVVATAVPVAVAIQPGNLPPDKEYILTNSQRMGGQQLSGYGILLIVSSIISNVTPIVIFAPPVDLVLSLVTASMTIHWTNPNNIHKISKHTEDTCCGFRSIYGLSMATAIINAIFGLTRFFTFCSTAGMFLYPDEPTPVYYYYFALGPSISSLLATVFSAYICSGSAPLPELATFTEHTQVIGSTPTRDVPPNVCCGPKVSKRYCYASIFLVIVGIMILAVSFYKYSYYWDDNYNYGGDYYYYYDSGYSYNKDYGYSYNKGYDSYYGYNKAQA